jgi:hypothetical protein
VEVELHLVALLLLVEAVILAAYLDLLAQLVLLVNPVDLVNLVLLVFLEIQANLQFNLVNLLLHHHANHAHKDLLAHLDLLVLLVMLVLLDNLVLLELMLPPANLDQKDLPVHLANPVPLVLPVNLVLLLNLNLLLPDLQDLLVMLDHPDHLDLLAPQETMELLVNPARKDHPVRTANPVLTANLVPLDKLVPPVVQEKKVSAPNIVLSMVVSSSKMELDDKNILHINMGNNFKWLFAAVYFYMSCTNKSKKLFCCFSL